MGLQRQDSSTEQPALHCRKAAITLTGLTHGAIGTALKESSHHALCICSGCVAGALHVDCPVTSLPAGSKAGGASMCACDTSLQKKGCISVWMGHHSSRQGVHLCVKGIPSWKASLGVRLQTVSLQLTSLPKHKVRLCVILGPASTANVASLCDCDTSLLPTAALTRCQPATLLLAPTPASKLATCCHAQCQSFAASRVCCPLSYSQMPACYRATAELKAPFMRLAHLMPILLPVDCAASRSLSSSL